MDLMTQGYYEENAAELARDYASAGTGIASWFERAFPRGCRVLDVGAASGRDLDRLLKGGWDASGVEPCQAFLREALAAYPHLDGRLSRDHLPQLSSIPDDCFEGVLCAAVLMHLPGDQVEEAVLTLRRILRPGGRLLTSLPVDDKGRSVKRREFQGRLYNGLSSTGLEEVLTARGFVSVARGRSLDSLDRPERQWVTQLFSLESAENSAGGPTVPVRHLGRGTR